MKWISVKDKLPEPLIAVLVWVDRPYQRIAMGWLRENNLWSLSLSGEQVKYWMPLPDSPEQDELSEILDVLSDLEAYQEAIAQQMAGQICEGITEVLSGHVKEIVAAAIKEAVK